MRGVHFAIMGSGDATATFARSGGAARAHDEAADAGRARALSAPRWAAARAGTDAAPAAAAPGAAAATTTTTARAPRAPSGGRVGTGFASNVLGYAEESTDAHRGEIPSTASLMVLIFLQRNFPRVSEVKGGFAGARQRRRST